MPISPLPASTVRLLGSGVAITSLCDLVKELVENAIDAQAASIEVSISSDSIKQIIVRDDGHGIVLEDFESLGRRSHTSKLRTFDELQTRGGGDTLGFRGEALASANSIAFVTVTTRTKVDPVASRIALKFGVGGVDNLTKASAPVGTTVQVSKLFEKLPVRKHEAIKNGKKSISQVRDLLKAYVLARPYLRLSLKVLEDCRGPSKGTWSFSPNRSPSVREAVLQIFGKGLASSCVEASRRLASDKLVPLHVQAPPAITLEALIPSPDCDVKSIQGKGAHISVDCRPISSTRGFGKKLVKILKSYLAGALGSQGSSVSLANPFFRLNISCPPSSYDSNVTPLKDEVIFSEEHRVVESFELMCRETYRGVNANCDNFKSRLTGRETLHNDPVPAGEDVRSLEKQDKYAGNSVPAAATTQDDTGEPAHEEAPRIRIKSRVNMARTASNTSIDTVVDQTLPVHLLPLSPIQEEISTRPQAQAIPEQSTPRYIAESIDRYLQPLQPLQEEAFEVWADETATMEGEGGEPVEAQRRFWRPPLQPLDDSELNQLAGLEELEWNTVEFQPRPFRTPHTSIRGVPVRPTQAMRGQGATGDRQATTRTQRGLPTDSSPPPRPQLLSDVPSPPAAPAQHGIRTPPSSDPHIGVRIPNPPFQPPRRSLPSQTSILDMSRNGSRMNPPERPRTSLDRISDRIGRRERSSLPVDMQRLGSEDLPYEVRSDVLEAVPSPVARVRHRPHGRNGGSTNASAGLRSVRNREIAPDRAHRDELEEIERNHHRISLPRQHSLQSQAISSIEVGEDEAASGGGPAPHPINTGSAARKRSSTSIVDSSAHDIEGVIDHQTERRSKRRCSRSRSGRSASRTSLPLDLASRRLWRTRDEWKTQAHWMELRTGPHELGRWGRVLSACEPYVVSGRLQSALPFRTMDEVRETESRLRELVDTWAKRTKREVEVEYTLRWAAKGKGTV